MGFNILTFDEELHFSDCFSLRNLVLGILTLRLSTSGGLSFILILCHMSTLFSAELKVIQSGADLDAGFNL